MTLWHKVGLDNYNTQYTRADLALYGHLNNFIEFSLQIQLYDEVKMV